MLSCSHPQQKKAFCQGLNLSARAATALANSMNWQQNGTSHRNSTKAFNLETGGEDTNMAVNHPVHFHLKYCTSLAQMTEVCRNINAAAGQERNMLSLSSFEVFKLGWSTSAHIYCHRNSEILSFTDLSANYFLLINRFHKFLQSQGASSHIMFYPTV